MKTSRLFLILLIMSSCSSISRSRMVRVKKADRNKVSVKNNRVFTNKVAVVNTDSAFSDPNLGYVDSDSSHSEHSFRGVQKKGDPIDVKEEYEKAGKHSLYALICLLLMPFVFFTLIGAFVWSIKAIKVYRRYKNPGVSERYILAMIVLVVSSLIVIISIALIGIFFYGILI